MLNQTKMKVGEVDSRKFVDNKLHCSSRGGFGGSFEVHISECQTFKLETEALKFWGFKSHLHIRTFHCFVEMLSQCSSTDLGMF